MTTSERNQMNAMEKLLALATKTVPMSEAGKYNRRKSLARLLNDAVREEVESIRQSNSPRCGTCGRECDPQNSDEGYSHCCNDRIEYADEWKLSGVVEDWAIDRVWNGVSYKLVPGNLTQTEMLKVFHKYTEGLAK